MEYFLSIGTLVFIMAMCRWASKHKKPWSLNQSVHGIPRFLWIFGGWALMSLSFWSFFN